jgi:hypothetical protein
VLTLLLVVLAAPKTTPPAAAATLPSRTAVFVVTKVDGDGATGRVEIQLLQALGEQDVDLVELDTLYPPAPPDPTALKALKALKDGKEAWDNLDVEVASAKYTEALGQLTAHPGTASARQLGEAHFFLALLALQEGGKAKTKKAQEEFARALVYDSALSVDVKTHGADAKKVFDKAKAEVEARAQGTLTIETAPGGAEASVGSKRLGLTPVDAPALTVGRHLVTVTRSGFEPEGAFAEVVQEGATATLKLKSTQNYGEVRSVASELATAGLGKGKVPDGARRLGELMKARFLLVASLTAGAGPFEVWDVETGSQVAGLRVSDQASLVAAATKVKQFVSNPSAFAPATAVARPGEGDSWLAAPVFKKWWFWTAVGVVVVGGATAGVVAGVSSAQGRPFNVVLGTP